MPTAAAADSIAARAGALRSLFAELARARRTLLLHPSNTELRERAIERLAGLAGPALARGPVELDLIDGALYLCGELVHAPHPLDPALGVLAAAGVQCIVAGPELAAPASLTALLALVSTRVDEPADAARVAWTAAIAGLALGGGRERAASGRHAVAALRLAQVPVGATTTALRAAVERAVSIDPALPALAAVLAQREVVAGPCAAIDAFLVRLLRDALERCAIGTAATIVDAAERCGSVDATALDALRAAVRDVCTVNWWQRAGNAVAEDPIAAAGLLLLLEPDRARDGSLPASVRALLP